MKMSNPSPHWLVNYIKYGDYSRYLHEFTILITGRPGPTGKTWLCDRLKENGYNAVEITESLSVNKGVTCVYDTNNHYSIAMNEGVMVITLNSTLPSYCIDSDKFKRDKKHFRECLSHYALLNDITCEFREDERGILTILFYDARGKKCTYVDYRTSSDRRGGVVFEPSVKECMVTINMFEQKNGMSEAFDIVKDYMQKYIFDRESVQDDED